MRSDQNQIAVIVPAHNEAKIIKGTLKNLRVHLAATHIYVVDDGSSDATAKLAKHYTKNVYRHRSNRGKGAAINSALQKWSLPKKYSLIMTLDADTRLTANFIPSMKAYFKRDLASIYICANGRVTTPLTNWLTAYRVWEYEIGQSIHKQAQAILGGIIVCPGCATVYRSALFKTVSFPTQAMAEDMDLTFMIHRQHLGKIGYVDQAEVITQDPRSLPDFIKQINRWYAGLWQNIIKHHVPWGGQMLDLEVALLASEALFSGLLFLSFFVLLPLSLTTDSHLFLLPFLIDICLFIIPTVIFTATRRHTKRIYLYLGHIYLLRLFSSLIFVISFFRVMFDQHTNMRWFSPQRYQLRLR